MDVTMAATRPAPALRRDTRHRVFGGVCAGLGRHMGVDPLIVRVAFVAAALAGGIGVALYAVAWVLVPAGDAPEAAARRRTSRGTIQIATGVGLLALSVLLTFRALGLLFSDVVVWPLVLVAAGGLAVAAALGFAFYVFRDGLGQAGLVFFVPFATSVLLLSLGADYSVFLTGRIWREARTRESLRAAVIRGGSQAALPITTAGLVLAGSFALLAIVPVRAFHHVAFTMAAGLVLDAFLVRTLLAPALITLLGPAGGWPARRMRGMRRGDRDLAPAEAAVADPASAARGGGSSGIDDPPGRPPA
jgi:phage shock protein PspC (stress-responsive transcriptional regulator)